MQISDANHLAPSPRNKLKIFLSSPQRFHAKLSMKSSFNSWDEFLFVSFEINAIRSNSHEKLATTKKHKGSDIFFLLGRRAAYCKQLKGIHKWHEHYFKMKVVTIETNQLIQYISVLISGRSKLPFLFCRME